MPEPTLRVLVVTTALVPEQLQVWSCASEAEGIDLHIAGALVHDRSESYLGELTVPTWGTTHVLTPTGWVARGRLWWNLTGLEDLIEQIRPDVVHVHSEAWGRLVAQSLQRPVPVIAHGAENVSLDHGARLEAAVRRRLTRRNAERLSGYASWNQEGVELLRRSGLRPGTPTAVAPAIVPDPTPFLAVEPTRHCEGPVRVGYIGRLVPEKGVQWLIAALDSIEGARLVIIGSGPYEDELRRQVARRGIDAEFVGVVGGDEMPAAIAGLDVVVVPSLARHGWSEQFGRVVCEAMLVGVPVISSDSGSLAAVVGDGGIVVPELDHDALHTQLARLVADPGERSRIGASGRDWAVKHLAPQAAADTLVTLWHAVAERP